MPNADDLPKRLLEDYVYEGPAEDQTEFFELHHCMKSHCPDQQIECVQAECGEELTACGVQPG